jgi:glycosyltransferase involved in cell wall biosynthesis
VERYGREILRRFTGKYRVEQTQANGVAGHFWEQFILPVRLSRDTVLWSPANSGPLVVRNQALTLHDLTPLEHPEWFTKTYSAWYRLLIPILAKRARIIFTPSDHVKQKVITRLGVKNVAVTPNGVDTSVFHPKINRSIASSTAKDAANLNKYILFVGTIEPRKNLESLVRAWCMIRDEFRDVHLVIAGRTGTIFPSMKIIAGERIRFLNYVAEEELTTLYANAMACGIPVIVSNGGALPEVVGNAGLIFDLAQPDTLIHAMRTCLRDRQIRGSLIEKGLARAKQFSWQTTADLIWNRLNEI